MGLVNGVQFDQFCLIVNCSVQFGHVAQSLLHRLVRNVFVPASSIKNPAIMTQKNGSDKFY